MCMSTAFEGLQIVPAGCGTFRELYLTEGQLGFQLQREEPQTAGFSYRPVQLSPRRGARGSCPGSLNARISNREQKAVDRILVVGHILADFIQRRVRLFHLSLVQQAARQQNARVELVVTHLFLSKQGESIADRLFCVREAAFLQVEPRQFDARLSRLGFGAGFLGDTFDVNNGRPGIRRPAAGGTIAYSIGSAIDFFSSDHEV